MGSVTRSITSAIEIFELSRRWKGDNRVGFSIFSRLRHPILLLVVLPVSAFGGGGWRSDRSGSSADGIVLARIRNVGERKVNSDRRPTVPVFRLTNVGGIAQEGPTVAQDVSSKMGRGLHVGVPLRPRHE